MQYFVRKCLLLTVLLGLLVGCANAPAGSAEASSGSTPAQADPLVTLLRSGGLAGETQTLAVQRDGTLTLTINGTIRTARANADELRPLVQALTGADWNQLDASYGRPVPDGYLYTIAGNGKQIQTYDGAERPAALESVLQQLTTLAERVRTAP